MKITAVKSYIAHPGKPYAPRKLRHPADEGP